MSLNYSHSNVMGIVKATKETISDNYSSSQYIEVLDTLLNNAIRPILRSTTFADVFISGVMHHYTENARRKISQVPKDKFLARGMLFLASDVYRKPKLYKKLRVERSVSAIVIKRFLSATADYEKYKRQYVLNPSPEILAKLRRIEDSVSYEEDSIDFCAIIREVKFWEKKYCEFKHQILEKYMRLITKQAQIYYAQNNSAIELDDLIQNYVLFASRALDKFDQNQGTLTTYILNWLNHAKNITAANESGIAYILPPSKRRENVINNKAESIDDDEAREIEIKSVDDLEQESERERIRWLAKIADPCGLARMSLGINEVLSKKDIEQQCAYEISI